ncbi:hypothetical protein PoB_002563900 [Plakobranchus ocellatus]|uniref:Uncharacterized protein n=1 Tax=Plakobranchus ocellatus TaxID=259542 RepID=A0AAV3ZUX0_9GAST|nr:hypothetical protein PoB_002563900 [Plakobranchus ocellatus]
MCQCVYYHLSALATCRATCENFLKKAEELRKFSKSYTIRFRPTTCGSEPSVSLQYDTIQANNLWLRTFSKFAIRYDTDQQPVAQNLQPSRAIVNHYVTVGRWSSQSLVNSHSIGQLVIVWRREGSRGNSGVPVIMSRRVQQPVVDSSIVDDHATDQAGSASCGTLS